MAKTSKTMASRKRPPPGAAPANGGAASSRPVGPLPPGVDALLARYARHLPPGGSVSVRLVKGPSSRSVDPIAARKAAARAGRAAGGDDPDGGAASGAGAGGGKGGGGIADPLSFPRIAKFSETVTPPDFVRGSLKDGRMYEEEVPMAKDESDEDESTAYKPSNLESNGEGGADPNNASSDAAQTNKKKKRRWRRNDPRPRRWVLQEKTEFFDRIRKRRQRAASGGGDDDNDEQGLSNQYHGVVESNASKYVVLGVAPTLNPAAATAPPAPSSRLAHEQIVVQTSHGFHTFSQPHKTASLSMEDAEAVIEKKRNAVTRYVMHGVAASRSNTADERAALASGVAGGGGGRGIGRRPLGPPPKAMSRARLLGKLAGGGGDDGDDGDDVMGDVRFSSKRGGGSRARRELLETLGEGAMADDDGVLGGANDAEFGGRRRFARVAAGKRDEGEGSKKGGKGGGDGKASAGFVSGATEDTMYQCDVAAKYEALDYDANEQFDCDDVNMGEDEIMDEGGGFAGGDYDSADDNVGDSDEEGNSDDDGLGGMATSSGLKAMLAKARGESPVPSASAPDATSLGTGIDSLDSTSKSPDSGTGGTGEQSIDTMKEAAERLKKEMDKKKQTETKKPPEKLENKGIEKDKDGKRLITLDAVRREIWLNNGAITSKRLMKKFDVAKNPERQALFKQVVFELCTMQMGADGKKHLVLKQHYSKIR